MSYNVQMKNDYSFLFSSLGGSSGSGGLGNLNFLSDYKSIKNGSYGKLLKAYYNKVGNNNTASTSKTETEDKSSKLSTSLAKDSAKTLTSINKDANSLKESADALLAKDSLFAEKEVKTKNDDGTTTTTKKYDMDAIYKAVSNFVSDYNSLIDTVKKSGSASVQSTASNMTNITSLYSKSLEKVGITVGSDKKLKLDEDAFKAADISKIKSTFNDPHSFANSISSQASFINYAASRESQKANTYNYTGSYDNNYSMGSLFNSMFQYDA